MHASGTIAPMSISMPPTLSATRLIMPRASLTSCVRAYIARSTLEHPLVNPAQRLNRFPASPLCSITWFIHGETEMIEPASAPEAGRPFDPILFGGPHTHPTVTYNPGPVHAFMLMFYPPALHKLTGIALAHYVDRFCPLCEVLDPAWIAMSQAVLAAPDDDARVALIEQFLEPQWHAVSASDEHRAGMVGDWVGRLGRQAAAAGWGNGVRNIERRVKAWAGQSMRTLRRMNRSEQSFLEARAKILGGTASWAEIATRAGYADQAHLCRETRQITGLSPTALARAGKDDESYWIYRVWS